ncbi:MULTISPECIES: DinB family protein [Sphingobacterium]|uniref:Damage-inducible protein DinB n=1 Tax=Sphingobacterium athyrii TaxID=2152717 RepID=A0A363NU58_9SPHI|nr:MULTISPECIES: DinB family protein [Sphingobacterium]PUV24309.1 damage-inducible protein DinB [Sphingobacterium athyrii]
MSNSLVQLWLYNDWANNLLIEKMKQDAERIPAGCLRLLSHIMNAQLIWLYRLNGEKPPVGVWDEHSLLTCEQYHQLASSGFTEKVYADECKIMEIVNYANTKNEQFQNSFGDILLHVFNHGTYHRAQIAVEMRRNGLDPINTDYISFVRT